MKTAKPRRTALAAKSQSGEYSVFTSSWYRNKTTGRSRRNAAKLIVRLQPCRADARNQAPKAALQKAPGIHEMSVDRYQHLRS